MNRLFGYKKKKMNDVKETKDALTIRQFFKEKKCDVKDFKVGEILGAGTFGCVRLGTIPIEGKPCPFAVKILSKVKVLRLKQSEHVKAEKANLHALKHNLIVKLFHTFQDDRNLYLVMEYVIGGDLFSFLREKGRLDHDSARIYAAEIVVALTYMHGKVLFDRFW